MTSPFGMLGWQTVSEVSGPQGQFNSIWVINANGNLQRNAQNAGVDVVAYVDLRFGDASKQVNSGVQTVVDTNVAAGTWALVRGCTDPQSGLLSLSTAGGRAIALSCGNVFLLSTGDGTDVRSDCIKLDLVAVNR